MLGWPLTRRSCQKKASLWEMAGPGDSGRSQATAAPKFCRFHGVAKEQKDTLRQSSHQGNGRCVLPRIPPGSVPGSINTISQKSWTGLWLPHHFREELDEAQDRTLGRVALLRTVPTTLLLSHNHPPKYFLILYTFPWQCKSPSAKELPW